MPLRTAVSVAPRVQAPSDRGLRGRRVHGHVEPGQRGRDPVGAAAGTLQLGPTARASAEVLAGVPRDQGPVADGRDRAMLQMTHAASPASDAASAKRRSALARSVPTEVAATPIASAISR